MLGEMLRMSGRDVRIERDALSHFEYGSDYSKHVEAQVIRDEHDALRDFEFPGGHSNILKSAESRN